MARHDSTSGVPGRGRLLAFNVGWLVSCGLAFLLSDAGTALADPAGDERPALAPSPLVLSHAIEGHVRQLALLRRAKAAHPWDFTASSTRVAGCDSKRKAIVIGAVVGAVVGAVISLYILEEFSGRPTFYSRRTSKFALYMIGGGAGTGALVGLATCG